MYLSRDQLVDHFTTTDQFIVPIKNLSQPSGPAGGLVYNAEDENLYYNTNSSYVQLSSSNSSLVEVVSALPAQPIPEGVIVYNSTTSSIYYSDGTQWEQLSVSGGSGGDVTGPASATDNAIVRFDSTTGKIVQNSVATLSDSGLLFTNNLNIPETTSTVGRIELNGFPWIHAYGTNSVFMGVNTGNFTYTGSGDNIGIGTDSLSTLTTGYSNVAIGSGSGLGVGAGYGNVYIGPAAGTSAVDTHYNVGIGISSLEGCTGNNNVGIGISSLEGCTGDNNVAIGFGAGSAVTACTNSIHISNYGLSSDDNVIRIGTPSDQTSAYIAGIYGVTDNTSSQQIMTIDNTGKLGSTTSSGSSLIYAQLRNANSSTTTFQPGAGVEYQMEYTVVENTAGISATINSITIGTTGVYEVYFYVSGANTAAYVGELRFKVNGTEVSWARVGNRESAITTGRTFGNTVVISLTAGDVLTIFAYSNTSVALIGTSATSIFRAKKL